MLSNKFSIELECSIHRSSSSSCTLRAEVAAAVTVAAAETVAGAAVAAVI